MARIITPHHQKLLNDLVIEFPNKDIKKIAADLERLIGIIHKDIPAKKRISTGRYSIIKALGKDMYDPLIEAEVKPFEFACELFDDPELEPFVRSTAVQIISLTGLGNDDLSPVLPVFEKAAADENWIVRECSSGLVRKLVKAYPEEMRSWYLEMVQSDDPNQRRFVSESLRPVVENKWFKNDPDYALGIIKHLFFESDPYPRTSVGNSLSDWLRVDEATGWPIIQELARNGDPNSYWIAYRACRNLVKKDTNKVMDLLGVEEYKYKKNDYRREKYQ